MSLGTFKQNAIDREQDKQFKKLKLRDSKGKYI